MGDEAEQPKLAQRSNPWFFSKNFQNIFDVLQEAKLNKPVSEACSPAIPNNAGAHFTRQP